MKITCQACAAKYTIADDKVQGKIVKIRCKKCGATIVVNGNDPAASASAAGADHAASSRFDYAGQAGAEQWTVNVADGDQRTMTDAEIVDAYHGGVVNDETFCWKDGMGDWLPLREIEQLYAQCTSTRAMPPQGMHESDEEEGVTKIQQPGGGMFGAGGGGGSVSPRPAAGMPAPAANGYAEAAPLAARRTGGRAPAADLFGSAAQAGSEEDVMTSAPAGMPQPHAHDDKLTGQRNENSVLFSLNALTSKGGPVGGGSSMPAGSEASGLIDIRQLSSQIGLGEDKKKKSRIDDIMNLGGGGAFAPSLGAPVLAAPPIEEYAPKPEDALLAGPAAAGQGKNKMILFGAIGAGVLLIAGAIGLATMLMHGKDEKAEAKAAASASAAAAGSTAPSASVAAATTDTPSASAMASAAPTDSSASAAAPSATATAATTATAKPTTTAAATTATAATAAAATTAAPTATATAAATAAAAAGGADQPFNMGEAKAKLGAIAGSVQSCKKGDSSGQGRAVITFAPSGMVQSVAVSGTGFEGTPMGACVASRFRGAHVPPFSGSPFSVSKSFSIN